MLNLIKKIFFSNQDINSFLADMDTEMDAMQATIIELQQRLKSKETTSENPNISLTNESMNS